MDLDTIFQEYLDHINGTLISVQNNGRQIVVDFTTQHHNVREFEEELKKSFDSYLSSLNWTYPTSLSFEDNKWQYTIILNENEDCLNSDRLYELVKDVRDLQALNLMFLRGLLDSTTYHGGPLDEESDLIADDLYTINLFGFLSVASQPYMEFMGVLPEDRGKLVKQRPFIAGYYPREKVNLLINRLKQNDNIVIVHTNLKTKETKSYNTENVNIIDDSIPLHNIGGVDDNYLSIKLYHNDILLSEFGISNRELVETHLDFVDITYTLYDNSLFPLISAELKALL